MYIQYIQYNPMLNIIHYYEVFANFLAGSQSIDPDNGTCLVNLLFPMYTSVMCSSADVCTLFPLDSCMYLVCTCMHACMQCSCPCIADSVG